MPGPGGGGFGGGGRGGGFSGGRGGGGFGGGRGGGFGGGFGGGPRGPHGGFGGPHRPPHRPPHHHHHHHHGFFFWPRRRYYGYGYYGGGCLGGFVGMLIAPIILIIIAISLIVGTLGAAGSSLGIVMEGGVSSYDENTFQDYANSKYEEVFGEYDAYEDNILIVFAADAEECIGYAYIGWVGDHVASDISYMFGGDYTKLGDAMYDHINAQSYKYSLDTNLASVVDALTGEAVKMGYTANSSLTCDEADNSAPSRLYNETNLDITEATVNPALERFTEQTGISISIVVDDIEDVFGKSIPGTAILTLIISLGMIALAVWLVYRAIKDKKSGGATTSSSSSASSSDTDSSSW